MLLRILLLLCYLSIITFLYSCFSNNEKATARKQNGIENIRSSKTALLDTLYSENIGDKTLKFYIDTSKNLLKTIGIYKQNVLIQKIQVNMLFDVFEYKAVDVDFDGFKDIMVRNNCGSGGCAYWIWNYSKTSNRFYFNTDLSDVLGLEIDSISKVNIIHYRFGWPHESWDTFKYIKHKPIFVGGKKIERWSDSTGKSYTETLYAKSKVTLH
jgi:hypothetical protein